LVGLFDLERDANLTFTYSSALAISSNSCSSSSFYCES